MSVPRQQGSGWVVPEILFGTQRVGVDSTRGGISSAGTFRIAPAVAGFFGLGATTTLTIAAGVVTAIRSWHLIDTEAAGAADDLDTINGTNVATGDILVLASVSAARVPTVKDGTGNLRLNGDFALDSPQDKITLIRNADATWHEIARSSNA